MSDVEVFFILRGEGEDQDFVAIDGQNLLFKTRAGAEKFIEALKVAIPDEYQVKGVDYDDLDPNGNVDPLSECPKCGMKSVRYEREPSSGELLGICKNEECKEVF